MGFRVSRLGARPELRSGRTALNGGAAFGRGTGLKGFDAQGCFSFGMSRAQAQALNFVGNGIRVGDEGLGLPPAPQCFVSWPGEFEPRMPVNTKPSSAFNSPFAKY